MDRTDQDVSAEALKTARKRSQFLKGLMMAGAGVAAAATLAPTASLAATRSAAWDREDYTILNFALTLEHLEKAFYDMAVASVPFTSASVKAVALTLQKDETAHVAALTAALTAAGVTPVSAAPSYNFGANTFATQEAFLKLSYMLEDTGVHAYLGAAGQIQNPKILLTAASILTVEARHAGAVRYLVGLPVTISPFDQGYNTAQVLAIAGPLIGT